jgi:GNAT superfamily N-acetyltransferase
VLKRLKPELNIAYEQIAGSQVVFVAPGCMVGRCVSLGLAGPVTANDLGRIEEFYRSRGDAAQIDVCPAADPTLLDLLKTRPYRLEEFNNVLARKINPGECFDGDGTKVEIRQVHGEAATELCPVIARGFTEGADPDPAFIEIFRPLYLAEGSFAFAAFADGKVVGGASGMIIPETRIATIFGSSTLPEYRGRGIQTAFLRVRLQLAADAGCEYAVAITHAGTTSQRNAERQGFTLAYSKVVLKHDFSL